MYVALSTAYCVVANLHTFCMIVILGIFGAMLLLAKKEVPCACTSSTCRLEPPASTTLLVLSGVHHIEYRCFKQHLVMQWSIYACMLVASDLITLSVHCTCLACNTIIKFFTILYIVVGVQWWI